MRKLAGLLFLFSLVVVCIGVFLVRFPAGPSTETFVLIPSRTGAPQMGAILERHGIIRNRYAFLAWRLYRGGGLKAGEYRFDHPAPMTEVYDRLHRGDVYTLAVTIPEGYNIFDEAKAFEASGLKKHADFLTGARQNVDLIADIDPAAASLEGYLFPDTYRFPPAMSTREMQATMVRRFRQATGSLGIASAESRKQVTMASLIEKETGAAGERGMVSSVFFNRLARGMALATDPSVIYGLLLAGQYRGTLYASDMRSDTPYNTYLHSGLPPGPICNPGLSSLRAALHPENTQHLYFVSDNAGHSMFADNLQEHDRNVSVYRQSIRRQVEH